MSEEFVRPKHLVRKINYLVKNRGCQKTKGVKKQGVIKVHNKLIPNMPIEILIKVVYIKLTFSFYSN